MDRAEAIEWLMGMVAIAMNYPLFEGREIELSLAAADVYNAVGINDQEIIAAAKEVLKNGS